MLRRVIRHTGDPRGARRCDQCGPLSLVVCGSRREKEDLYLQVSPWGIRTAPSLSKPLCRRALVLSAPLLVVDACAQPSACIMVACTVDDRHAYRTSTRHRGEVGDAAVDTTPFSSITDSDAYCFFCAVHLVLLGSWSVCRCVLVLESCMMTPWSLSLRSLSQHATNAGVRVPEDPGRVCGCVLWYL